MHHEPAVAGPARRGPALERGFSIVTAIFLVVVLGLLAAFIVAVTGLQVSSHQLDILGSRAYQAARSGIEWAAWQTLDPNNASGAGLPPCPASPTHLAGLAGSLGAFTVTVTCAPATTTEGNRDVRAYSVVATACNQPAGGSCPNPAPGAGYVERQLQATFSKCKDATAAPPRFACG
jgi:MSHA biogenesis protein MshP